MPTICPNCRHIREENATCPDWQCPACQIAYTKAGGTYSPKVEIHSNKVSRLDQPSHGKWLIVIALILGCVLWFAKGNGGLGRHANNSISKSQAGQAQPLVILYGTSWCGYCKATREFFQAHQIKFQDIDIEQSKEGLAAYKQIGGQGVPVVVIGDQIVDGYNEETFKQLLEAWL